SDATEYDILSDIQQSFSQTNSSSSSRGYDYSGNILYMHKFHKRGRTISLNGSADMNNKNTPGNLYSLDEYLKDTTLLNQQYNQPTQGYTLSSSLSYTEPIDSNSLLQFNYTPSVNINNTNKRTYNYDSTGEWYTQVDTALSNQYQNTYITQTAGISYRLNHGKKYFLMVSVNPQYSTLTSRQEYPVTPPEVRRTYTSVLPRVVFNYKFSQSKNLRIMYRSNVTPPSISQLQNVVNNSNPLLLNTGNPQLKEDFEQSFIARYGATNSKAATTFLVYMYANYIQNYIGNASFIPLRDSALSNGTTLFTGSQLSQPVNLQGYWNAKTFVTYGWLIHPLKVNLNLNSGVVYTRTPALINDITNYSSNYTYSEGLVLSSNISENVDYTLSYTGNYSTVKNTLQNESDDNYYTGIATGKINLIFFKGLIVNTSLSQTSYTGLASSYNQAIYLWNASIGYKFLKNKTLQVSISGTDLLNQNTSITRTVTDTYIQDSQTEVLRRYFMLNLQLNIRKYKTTTPPAEDKGAGAKG
ncbi:MAG TPA: outer membrane beta-barrel protein, partial [Bacteroidia bacterium]|nr:outer membrane beta-barrel protein [Bacteroidia bacterium]